MKKIIRFIIFVPIGIVVVPITWFINEVLLENRYHNGGWFSEYWKSFYEELVLLK